MANTTSKRVGRPKAIPQSGPLVLGIAKARVKVEIDLAEVVADELTEYARWVERSVGPSAIDAVATTVEFALREIFRRDRLWQEKRRKASGPQAAPPPPAPKAAAPISLPPPSSASRPAPTAASAAPGR